MTSTVYEFYRIRGIKGCEGADEWPVEPAATKGPLAATEGPLAATAFSSPRASGSGTKGSP